MALVTTTAVAAPADSTAFMQDLTARAMTILKDPHDSPADRVTAFKSLFESAFDTPAIGQYVLGGAWATATPAQQKAYLAAFDPYVATIYAQRFSNYHGEELRIQGGASGNAAVSTVHSQVIHTDGSPPTPIDWSVAREGEGFKITNVVVDGLSLTTEQRDEFASVVRNGGGGQAGVQALITQLNQKVAGH